LAFATFVVSPMWLTSIMNTNCQGR